ncbi:hypothetical protein CQW23_25780 [Capsicum baccatum]|uniref:Ubiquitin-like protease family profile domain-containing protein n=1 Tax=Capsicum baccatum TaxID=33114 RepID=A0A2G2VLY8_CAPBA|nr:hypothetical protein CQW23_25780 [Capsicum baccatum]
MAYEEECSNEELGKKNIPDVEDLSDEVGGTITDSIQSAVDKILFGLSTPATTKSLDVGASNKMTERHWDLSDNQIPPDFPDAQDVVDINKDEKLKYAFDGYNINQDLPNELMIDYSQWIVVGLLKTHSAKDCGIFVCAYAEILSEGLQVHLCEFDSACHRARYASLLWHYGMEKANEGYTSDNGDPPRPRKSVIEEIEANAIVTLE